MIVTENINVPILVYRQIKDYYSFDTIDACQYIVSPVAFEEQIKYLSDKHYEAISFKDLFDVLTVGAIFAAILLKNILSDDKIKKFESIVKSITFGFKLS